MCDVSVCVCGVYVWCECVCVCVCVCLCVCVCVCVCVYKYTSFKSCVCMYEYILTFVFLNIEIITNMNHLNSAYDAVLNAVFCRLLSSF